MTCWVSVEDRLPTNVKCKWFRVKFNLNNGDSRAYEKAITGKLYQSGFKFDIHGGETVTHWWDQNTKND